MAVMSAEPRSPFLHTPSVPSEDSLVILHLKRDSLVPIKLTTRSDQGYAEGAVINTRFGSFPHSTLIGVPWGSQVRASKVDTGTRGRRGKKGDKIESDPQTDKAIPGTEQKRKATDEPSRSDRPDNKKLKREQDEELTTQDESTIKAPIEAGSGFAHLLSPTPEAWTSSLDHRTQVVYVPDYSYILSRLRVKPGEGLIEAGAGSGSFTHAAARAVFNGYRGSTTPSDDETGRMYSFEYHEHRVQTLQQELIDHELDQIVTLTHRDVCNDGFVTADPIDSPANVVAIFLDLPAPWLALRHITRSACTLLSKIDPIRLCAFSPCIEQVTSTVAALRSAGWVAIEMVEVANRRIDVRRERIGLKEEGLRGVNAVAGSVEESLERLRVVDSKLKEFHKGSDPARRAVADKRENKAKAAQSKAARLEQIKRDAQQRKLYKEGNLVHRTEAEIKTHTSYLVFAILPTEWSEEDEKRCAEMYPLPPTK